MWLHLLTFCVFCLQRNDIAMAITKFDQFDFLIDIVPRDDLKPPKRQVGKWDTDRIVMTSKKQVSIKCFASMLKSKIIWSLFSEAFSLLANWGCCKHPWLEADVETAKAFSRMFAASHCLWLPAIASTMSSTKDQFS